jgi:RHS repeat-associated protein
VDTLDLSSFAMYPLHDWRGNATAIAFAGGRPLFNGNVQYTPPLPADENKLLTAYRERTRDSRRVTSWMGSLLTGQMTATGLEYRRNRYYDPKSGRFTQEDPIGLGGGLNLYGFGGGDPVNYSDPLGLCKHPMGRDFCPETQGLKGPGLLDPIMILSGGLAGLVDNMFGGIGADAVADVAAQRAAAKLVPNPGGKLGSLAHRAAVATAAKELETDGYTITAGGGRLAERAINVMGDRVRFPDIEAVRDGTRVFVNIGRVTKAGNPVAREVRALNDLRSTGVEARFVPYKP